jgi:hypothetical protein
MPRHATCERVPTVRGRTLDGVDRRRPLQASAGERLADEMLGRVVERWPGARLWPKPRIADVLDIDDSGITADEYSYALKAHFDFVVCRHDRDRLRDIPQFAVEFDGRQHQTDTTQIQRDHRKDAICAQLGLPLVRAREPALKQIGDQALLEWLAELWFVYHDLWPVVAGGDDDDDRDLFDERRRSSWFSYARIWQQLDPSGDLDRHRIAGPYDPFGAFRHEFQRFVHGHKAVGMWRSYAGEDDQGIARGVIRLDLDGHGCLLGEGRCRLQHFIPAPLLAQTIALDLALVEIVEQTRDYTAGRRAPIDDAAAGERIGDLPLSPLLQLPALSDDDFYEIALSWLGPNASEAQRQDAWMFAHVDRHQDDEDRDRW